MRLPTSNGPYGPARRLYRSFAETCVLPDRTTLLLNLFPATVTSWLVVAIVTAPLTGEPNICITWAFVRHVTPWPAVTRDWRPVSVVVHAGEPPGRAVAR